MIPNPFEAKGLPNPELEPEQLNTILAALRFWQRVGPSLGGPEIPIATNGGETEILSNREIDWLVEEINHKGLSFASTPTAYAACHALCDAWDKGADSGSVEWEDLITAAALAREATGREAHCSEDLPPLEEVERGVECVWRLVYQEVHGAHLPAKLSLTEKEELRSRLEDDLEWTQQRLRLVIDRNDPECDWASPAVIKAIRETLPPTLLILVFSDY